MGAIYVQIMVLKIQKKICGSILLSPFATFFLLISNYLCISSQVKLCFSLLFIILVKFLSFLLFANSMYYTGAMMD